jgi:hypothetical protein
MFGILKFLIWTGCAMALGAWMAPELTRLVTKAPLSNQLEAAKGEFQEKLEDAKDVLSSVKDQKVRERHSDKDRDTLNKLIAKRAGPK